MNTLFVGKSPEMLQFCKSHSHDCWEIVIPTLGLGIAETDGDSFEFHPGSLYIIPPTVAHSSFSETNFTDIYIHTSQLPFAKDRITPIYGFKNLPYLAELIYDLYLNKTADSIHAINTAVDFIVQISLGISRSPSHNPLAEEIKDLLIKNISNPDINMKFLEAEFQYNGDYLRRLFKKEYGETPMEYMDNLRLNHAKDLLKNMPMYSIGQISELCGFSDALYFSRFFKKHTDISPKTFRQA